jgi:serine/threonine protein kinase/Tfp pilus assembly protein PilF
MPRDTSSEEERIFDGARRLKDPAQRRIYLEASCGGDAGLRERIENLLESDSEADEFFSEGSAAITHSTLLLSAAQQAGDRIGRYRLLQQIGEGGSGLVYMAEQEEPVRRRVALKVIKLGMDTKNVVARFEAERQALAMMDHSNIAKVFDGGATDNGRPFFVMELVRGVKITEYCDEHRLSTRERLELFVKVCQAVQHAHQKGIIHRDLKPSNILVTINDGEAVPKVIDFGIAKAIQGRLTDHTLFTAFEQLLGTPAYMSPEQALMTSVDVDTRSDIYSLGVLLYELLSGKTPFDTQELLAAGIDQLRKTIVEREPLRPSTRVQQMLDLELTTTAERRRSNVPKLIHTLRGDLDWIVMKCLEKDRARRYETANSLALDVRRSLNNEPVMARPAGMLYRLRKVFARNQRAFTACAIIVTLFLPLAGYFFFFPRDVMLEWKSANPEVNSLVDQGERVLLSEIPGRLLQASNYFQRAIDLDPNHLPAYSGMAEACRHFFAFERLRPLAEKMMEIAPHSAEAHLAYSHILWNDWHFQEALEDSRKTLKRPYYTKRARGRKHLAYGFQLLQSGFPERALEQYRFAEKLLPADTTIKHHLGHPYLARRDFQNALSYYQRSLDLEPQHWLGHQWKARVYEEMGDMDNAVREYRQFLLVRGDDPVKVTEICTAQLEQFRQGGAPAYWRKKIEFALAAPKPNLYAIATFHARLGERDRAYEFLEKACETKSFTQGLMFDLCWDHNDPRFQKIARGIGILR